MFQDIGNNPDHMQVIQIFTRVPFCMNDFIKSLKFDTFLS